MAPLEILNWLNVAVTVELHLLERNRVNARLTGQNLLKLSAKGPKLLSRLQFYRTRFQLI